MSLRDQGYKFVKRGNIFKWIHPDEVCDSDIDCTDMSDEEFDVIVELTLTTN